jgi:hypothetical protein
VTSIPRLQARDHFANRAERQAGERRELALRDELSGRMRAAMSCCWKRSYACQRNWRGGSGVRGPPA